MSLLLSDEQREFQNTLRSFFSEKFSSEVVRKRIERKSSSETTFWSSLLELGLSASFGSENDEGFGLGSQELSILAFESGYVLVPEPIVEHALFGSLLLSTLSSEITKSVLKARFGSDVLQQIVGGSKRVTVVPAITVNQDIIIKSKTASGKFRFVPALEGASYLVFTATHERKRSVYIAQIDKNLEYTEEDTLDRTIKRYQGALNSIDCEQLEISFELLQQLEQTMIACQIAGSAARAVAMTIEFVKQRKQFDVPVGGFQAVQHRLADMYLASEAIRALSNFAAWAAHNSVDQLPLAAGSALLFALEKGAQVVEGAIQLHGGIGFTWEYDLHLYLRRVKMLQALYRENSEALIEQTSL